MVFAYAISVGENIYCVNEQSAILVTISNELNIVIPMPTTGTANYLDINIGQIEEIMREEKEIHFQPSSSPSKLFEVLTIWISKSSEEAYYFNARGCFADSIDLVFTSAGAASIVQQSIRSRIACNLGTSQSEPVDISQRLSEGFDEPSATQLTTQLSEQPCNGLVNATIQANETQQKYSIHSVAHLSIPECDESALEYINQSQLKTSVASPHDAHAPQLVALVDSAMSPVEPHQFDELSPKLTTVEYNFEDTSDDGFSSPATRPGGPSLSKSGQAMWNRQRTLANSYGGVPSGGRPINIPSIEKDEDVDSLFHVKSSTYTSRKKSADQANLQSYEKVDRRRASKIFSPPDLNGGMLGRQGLTKLSQRMRRDVGEPPVGISIIPEQTHGDATKKDKRKHEDPRLALTKKILLSDQQPRDLERSKSPSNSQIGGNSENASTDKQDRCENEYDFPTSAKKAPTAHLPTPIAIMCAQSSFRSDRQPNTKPIPPPKPIPKGASEWSKSSLIHDGGRPKAIHGTTKSIPSKRIRNNDDDAMDRTNRNAGFDIRQAKESEIPQRQRKKQLNGKSRSRTKPIRSKDDLAFSTHKAQNGKINKSRKSRAVPVPLAQSRGRRVAALTANRKIQDLVECDTSEDEKDIESTHEKGKSTERPGQKNRSPPSRASVLTKSKSSTKTRPSSVTSRESEGQIMQIHESDTITSALPRANSTKNESEKVRILDSVDLPTNELVLPADRVIKGDNTLQRLPLNVSYALSIDDGRGHQARSKLTNVKLKKLEIQDSASATNSRVLEEQGLDHDNTMPLSTFTCKTVTPEVHLSDHVDALDDTGGGFFEDATAFSHEDTTSLAKNPTNQEIPKPPMPNSDFENTHGPHACEEGEIDIIPRAADTSTNPIRSTPKVSIAAKLQSALSSVKNSRSSTKAEGKLQRVSKRGALTRTEVTAPPLDMTNKLATRATKKAIVPTKKDVGPDAMRTDQSSVKENDIPSLKKTLESREIRSSPTVDSTLPLVTKSRHRTPTTYSQVRVPITTPYALGIANVVENGESDKLPSVNEVSLKDVQKSPKSLSLNPDSRKSNREASKRNLERQIVSATRMENIPHGPQGTSKQEFGSANPANAPKSKSGAISFNDRVLRAETPTKTLLDFDRKPNVISFDSKGPRNQGIVSNRRVGPIQAIEDQKLEKSGTIKVKTLKRTVQDVGEDSFGSGQYDAVIKRPRTSIDVPRTREKAPEGVQKRSISIIKESTQKPSSQSTRVDENGSPLPFVHSRKIGLQRNGRQISFETAAQSPTSEQGAKDGNDLIMSKDGLGVLDLGLPSLQDLSPPSASSFRFIPSSCIKHRPSSPNAPSGIIEEYTAHKVNSSGKFVNIRTDNVVMAVRPSDPFVGIHHNHHNHQNNFIELLRRSSHIPDQGSNEDPDKTLVASGLAEGKNNSDTASSTSSNSDSSQPNEHSPSEAPSSSEGGSDDKDDWVAALQPHQGETWEVLCEISHVSRAKLWLGMFIVN